MNNQYKKLLGGRIRSEANDLKRTEEAIAKDLGYDVKKVLDIFNGNCEEEDQIQMIRDMGKKFPIDEADLYLNKNDCTHSVKITRAAESEASGRITKRKNRNNQLDDYYEYRDTAMSKFSPYRPEWIRELRVVDDADPNNPDVQYNKGHLLHQYTLFVGPVNYYWELNGKRYCREMNTGDSVYGTPWWPHTFANRDGSKLAYILAVTFGGDVRRSQKELYALGQKARGYVLDYRKPNMASIQLVLQHMANADLTKELLQKRINQIGSRLDLANVLNENHVMTNEERKVLAEALTVEEMDLMVPVYKESDEVLFKPFSNEDGYLYPDNNTAAYRIHRMAETTKMPLLRGATVKVLQKEANLENGFSHSLHSWVYNYGDVEVKVRWIDNKQVHEAILAPNDSIYIQPFIRHAYSVQNHEGTLCVIRTSGFMNLQAQREFSYMSEVDRAIFEDGLWF